MLRLHAILRCHFSLFRYDIDADFAGCRRHAAGTDIYAFDFLRRYNGFSLHGTPHVIPWPSLFSVA